MSDVDEFDFQPVRIDPKAKPREVERIPVFYIGDQEYTAKKNIGGRDALVAMRKAAKEGPGAMEWQLLVQGLGEEAIDDLIACEGVTDEQIKQLFSQLTRMYFGQIARLGKAKKS